MCVLLRVSAIQKLLVVQNDNATIISFYLGTVNTEKLSDYFSHTDALITFNILLIS